MLPGARYGAATPRPPVGAEDAVHQPDPADDEEASLDDLLTTKEGWHRFVDKEPAPPTLSTDLTLPKLRHRWSAP